MLSDTRVSYITQALVDGMTPQGEVFTREELVLALNSLVRVIENTVEAEIYSDAQSLVHEGENVKDAIARLEQSNEATSDEEFYLSFPFLFGRLCQASDLADRCNFSEHISFEE